MSDLPSGWTSTSLGEITKPRGEKAAPSTLGNTPFVGMDHIEAETSRLLATQPVAELKSSVSIFKKGDILYGRLRPYLNKVHQAQFDGAASAEFIVIPPSPVIEQRYLAYRMRCPDFVSLASKRSTGDRPRVTFESVSDFTIALPPLPEQRRIVAKIDSLFGGAKRACDQLDHVPRLVEKYKQTILAKAFKSAPARKARVEELFEWSSGKNLPTKQHAGGDVPVIGGNGVSGLHDTPLINFPTLVIGRVGAQCGNVHRSDGPAWITDNAIYAKAISEKIDLDFAVFFFQSANLNSLAGGTGQPYVNQTVLNSLSIPLPSLAEQKLAVRRVKQAALWVGRLASEAASARKLIDRLNQTILAKAFRGELVPQDLNNEPASLLIERLRAEQPIKSNTRGLKVRVRQSRKAR